MEYFFAGIVLALLFFALRDEFRSGGSLSLSPSAWQRRRLDDLVDDDWRGELVVLPLPNGWDAQDVLVTLSEIQAL